MQSAEEQIQKTVLSLEAGDLARLIWWLVMVMLALGLSVHYLVFQFRGLPVSQAMDQAQIGREILRGHGWQTKFVRPLAMGELQRHGFDPKTAVWNDTYNAPIPPLLDAAAIYIPMREGWALTNQKYVYAGDRAIATMETLFFLLSLVVLYFIALDLFDQRLAMIATGLVLVSDVMWQYSLSGLPQMFLLLLLYLGVYALLRAMRARALGEPHLGWIAASAAAFGLMALTHALAIFIFVPVLGFVFLFFRPRTGIVMLLIFLAMYAPWLVRNAMVCGDFRGLAGFSALDGIVRTEAGHMRRFAIDLGTTSGNYYAENFRSHLTEQLNRLMEYIGWSPMTLVAFVSVLHGFRRPTTAMFRWLLFLMWISAIIGMGIFGLKDEHGIGANQFYILFVPLLTCYGVAYILVQWDRRIGLGFILPQWQHRSAVHRFLRVSMIVATVFLTSIPLLLRKTMDKQIWPVQWPPYTPPSIAQMSQWVGQDEIIASDMPWATAWYADRRSLWLPYEQQALIDISDYHQLGAPVVMLYFTPVSGTQNYLGDLISGEYKNWTSYIVRTVDSGKSPYPFKSILGMPECVVYMTHMPAGVTSDEAK